jgi:hypothetical protein
MRPGLANQTGPRIYRDRQPVVRSLRDREPVPEEPDYMSGSMLADIEPFDRASSRSAPKV